MRALLVSLCLLLAACPATPGSPGEPGQPGPTGAVGPAGPTGPQGVPGEVGVEGPAGPAGANGGQGPVGPQGLQGPQGAVLVLDGGVVTGPAGASVAVTPVPVGDATCPSGGVRLTQLSDGGLSYLCHGARGDAGVQGLQGVVGPMGATGFTPLVTLLPNLSPQCATGGVLFTLVDGGTTFVCNGAQGAPGLQGMTGSVGAMGPAGPQGVAGPTGGAGPAGPQGVAGPTGATGGVGPAGAAGSTGPQGMVGATGPSGSAGPSGAMGPAGSVLYLDGGAVVVTSVSVQFVGFTLATYTGDLGGLPGAAEKCRLEFAADSYLCTVADYDLANTTAVPPTAAGAWVDYNRADNGTRSTGPCTQSVSPWTNAATPFSASGASISSTGYSGSATCSLSKHLSCCRGSRTGFRGYTTALFTGDLGGIPGANAKCRVDFPGSWLCTLAEYDLANTAARPPTAAGAWVDYNRTASGSRSTSACTQTVSPWTNAATPFSASGASIASTGYFGSASCALSKHLSCCGG